MIMILYSPVKELIRLAIAEDLGTGDVTTTSVVPRETIIKGNFIAKEAGVVCGFVVARYVFSQLDPTVQFVPEIADGDKVSAGQVIATIKGPAQAVLSGERVALNFLQYLSGIATQTHQLVEKVAGTGLQIVDTRKTAPGMRILSKWAVKMGGGGNHRMNLSDGILIKDNHIKAAGGIIPAVKAARAHAPRTLKIEVETETLDQVKEALEAGADIIMLDNMELSTMKQAVKIIDGRALTEASGNMDRKDLAEVAATGVDMVSIGALTHTVKALDISLRFV
jgi:nicotinate-nucleotide pyrophosphorylase (carboxylating)